MGRGCRIALAVAEPDRIAMAKHDVVGAGSTVYRLVKVVAHGIVIGQVLEVRSIPVLDVIKAHGGRPFAGGCGVGRVLGAEVAGCARPLVPAPTVVSTQGNSAASHPEGLLAVAWLTSAIQLLPHLVEAMHRAGGIGVVGEGVSVG